MTDTDPILREALECLPDGVSVYDADGRPIFFNSVSNQRFPNIKEAFENGAATLREAQRYSIRKSRPDASEEEIDEIATRFWIKIRAGEPYEIQLPSGRTVKVTWRRMSDGRMVAISVDITELREREAELEKAREAADAANRSKSFFLANMSHEIRTPLNGVLGMAQALQKATDLTAERKAQVSTILESGRTLLALLNDILDLSKIEANKFEIVPVDTNLKELLERVCTLWRSNAEEKQLWLNLSVDGDIPQLVRIDPVRVQQCASNLVSNAIKFTEAGGVTIAARMIEAIGAPPKIAIDVTDTGKGVDAEALGKLFEPFTQADATISREYGGTGLGLSIIRRLSQAMGGEASATSAPGEGSTFSFSFSAEPAAEKPCGPDARAPDATAPSRAMPLAGLRVLLVDDHPINRQVAKLFLAPHDVDVVEAEDGHEALKALKRESFDLVLLDVHMPGMDGPTTLRHIRDCVQSYASIPVIALTADAMEGDKERYLSLGMNGYVSKPIGDEDLIAEIGRVMSASTQAWSLKSA
jgi:signal transduction histidine kinase/ActR/RegA family two-component response regulator